MKNAVICNNSSVRTILQKFTANAVFPRIIQLVFVLIGLIVTWNILGFELTDIHNSGRVRGEPDYLDYTENIEGINPLYEIKDGALTKWKDTNLKFANRNKITHIAFLKVHKAGSTTMQNLMFRFGMKHYLNIVLPKSKNYLHSHENAMPLKQAEHYDILAVHATYSPELFRSLLPEDTVYIGIVREPVARVISAAYYYRDVWQIGYLKKIPKANFIQNLVQRPEKYEKSFYSYTRNAMGKDFGFNEVKPTDIEYIQKYLDELNSRFLLVLIVEKFDESLVMMRRVLGWSISDILYLKTNAYEHKPVVLSESELKKLRQTSFQDFKIYEYFLNVFMEKLKHAEPDFWEEVQYFKTVLEQVQEFCLKVDTSKNSKLVIHRSNWDDKFKVSSAECAWMRTKEKPFIAKLRKRHVLLHK